MKSRGFSLIELIVVVAIMGMLTAIAVPAYIDNVLRSARAEGKTALLDVLQAQENYFINEGSYTTNLTLVNFNNPHITSSGRYSITAGQCSDGSSIESCVLLTASAIGEQVDDGNLTINSRGERTHDGQSGWKK